MKHNVVGRICTKYNWYHLKGFLGCLLASIDKYGQKKTWVNVWHLEVRPFLGRISELLLWGSCQIHRFISIETIIQCYRTNLHNSKAFLCQITNSRNWYREYTTYFRLYLLISVNGSNRHCRREITSEQSQQGNMCHSYVCLLIPNTISNTYVDDLSACMYF